VSSKKENKKSRQKSGRLGIRESRVRKSFKKKFSRYLVEEEKEEKFEEQVRKDKDG
jgi:hypothetical protein